VSGQLEFGEEDRLTTLRRAWELSLHLLASKVNSVPLESFIRPIQPLGFEANIVTLGVTSTYHKERLEKNHLNAIRSALEFHLDTTGLQIEFVILTREQRTAGAQPRSATSKAKNDQPTLPLDEDEDEEMTAATPPATSASYTTPARVQNASMRSSHRKGEPKHNEPDLPTIPSLPLNERYTLDNFLVGPRSNRMAYAGAVNVAEKPGNSYNPLFLYGGPGLGKTHLLQGIAHSIRKARPQTRIAYVSGEFFTQHYVTSLRERTTEMFRRQYREVDVWLVDDIQFVAGKEHTKEEFFHTFTALYQSGKQIVIASDRSPRELNTMDERLRSRFQSGLIADINPPEVETRIAFLQECRKREKAEVSDEVLNYIADAIQSNMRTLEGALTRLMAYSSIMNAPMSAELAHNVLSEYFIEKPIRYRRVKIEDVVALVAERFGTTPEAIRGPGRKQDISLARQVAIHLCRELMPESNMVLIGAAFGGRDHATIVYACQRLKALMEVDTELKMMVAQMMKELSG